MLLIELLKYIREQWGLNKTATIIGLNVGVIGITTTLAINFIPDKPDKLEEKENI